MNINSKLKEKLDRRISKFIKEMTPEDGSLFKSSELLNKYKNSLYEFTHKVYGELDKNFINEELSALDSNITPAVKDSTGGIDVIITSILDVEIAKIIYQNGLDNQRRGKDERGKELDDGREAMRRAMQFLLEPNFQDGPYGKVTSELGPYIYQHESKVDLSQSSGCLLVFIIFSGFISTLLGVALLN